MALDGFDQGALFAADVTAGADEQFQIEIQLAAENFLADQTCLCAPPQLFRKNFFLQRILVADVENASLGASNQSGNNHSFGNQMRQVAQDEAILDGARFA